MFNVELCWSPGFIRQFSRKSDFVLSFSEFIWSREQKSNATISCVDLLCTCLQNELWPSTIQIKTVITVFYHMALALASWLNWLHPTCLYSAVWSTHCGQSATCVWVNVSLTASKTLLRWWMLSGVLTHGRQCPSAVDKWACNGSPWLIMEDQSFRPLMPSLNLLGPGHQVYTPNCVLPPTWKTVCRELWTFKLVQTLITSFRFLHACHWQFLFPHLLSSSKQKLEHLEYPVPDHVSVSSST